MGYSILKYSIFFEKRSSRSRRETRESRKMWSVKEVEWKEKQSYKIQGRGRVFVEE